MKEENKQIGKGLWPFIFTLHIQPASLVFWSGSLEIKEKPYFEPQLLKFDQLILTLYTLSIYPSLHNQLIRTLFEGRAVLVDQVSKYLILIFLPGKFHCFWCKMTFHGHKKSSSYISKRTFCRFNVFFID